MGRKICIRQVSPLSIQAAPGGDKVLAAGDRRWVVPGGFLLSPLRVFILFYFWLVYFYFGHCQNWTAPGEMLNMEGSNFWPRKGEPSVSQPFFSISCTFCKMRFRVRVHPKPSPVFPALPDPHPTGMSPR